MLKRVCLGQEQGVLSNTALDKQTLISLLLPLTNNFSWRFLFYIKPLKRRDYMFNDIKKQELLAQIVEKLKQIETKIADLNKFIKDSKKPVKTQISGSKDISQ